MNAYLMRNRWLLEPVLAVVFFVCAGLSTGGTYSIVSEGRRNTLPFWAGLVALSVAIGLARRWSVMSLALGAATLIGQLLFPIGIFDPGLIYLGYILVILIAAASVRDWMRVAVCVFAVGVGISVAGLLSWWFSIGHNNTGERMLLFAFWVGTSLCAWLVGTLVSLWFDTHKSELAGATNKLRKADGDLAVAAQHERIAQDVHDIMAHSLSVILAQAEGARLVALRNPEAVEEPLRAIASTARASLTDVRVLIETLLGEPENSVRRGMSDVADLVEQFSAAGLAISVECSGEMDQLTTAQQLAVYRIIEESMTNSLKHAGVGADVRLVLRGARDGVAISIMSCPETGESVAPVISSDGRGLIGMRERAHLAGGWLDAGADDDVVGGFLVTGYIPSVSHEVPTV